jgi:hypothetical protein
MRRQRGKSLQTTPTGGSVCVYRSPAGLRCIVGGAMPDEQYRPDFDAPDTALNDAVNLPSDALPGVSRYFLKCLQGVHDDMKGEWGAVEEGKMRDLADRFGLTYTPPAEEAPR